MHIGVRVGEASLGIIQNSAAVDQSPASAAAGSAHFSVQLSTGIWQQVALGVYLDHVTLHVDCDVVDTLPWRRRVVANGDGHDNGNGVLGSSVVLSIGKAFIESSRYRRFNVSVIFIHDYCLCLPQVL